MDAKQLAEIKAREQAATSAPWHWDVATANKSVDLENRRDKIMDFVRYGTNQAAPRFNVDGIMERADTLTKSIPGMEHHRGFDDYINHPDAIFIEHARTDIPALVAEVERLHGIESELAYEKRANETIPVMNKLVNDSAKKIKEQKNKIATLEKALELAVQSKVSAIQSNKMLCDYFIQQAQE